MLCCYTVWVLIGGPPYCFNKKWYIQIKEQEPKSEYLLLKLLHVVFRYRHTFTYIDSAYLMFADKKLLISYNSQWCDARCTCTLCIPHRRRHSFLIIRDVVSRHRVHTFVLMKDQTDLVQKAVKPSYRNINLNICLWYVNGLNEILNTCFIPTDITMATKHYDSNQYVYVYNSPSFAS